MFVNRYDCIDDGTLEPSVKPTNSKKSKYVILLLKKCMKGSFSLVAFTRNRH